MFDSRHQIVSATTGRIAVLVLAAFAAPLAHALNHQQSPIDITSATSVYSVLPPLQFTYGTSIDLSVTNTGSPGEEATIRATPTTASNKVALSGVDYGLLQFHFHTEAEHAINGVRSEMEMHLVHRDSSGTLLVVGRLIKAGAANAALAPMFSALPAEGSPLALTNFNLASLLPTDLSSFRYDGSLTTSPYTEGVKWNVLAEELTMSHEQIEAFRTLFHEPEGNTRPLQALAGRMIQTDVVGFAAPIPEPANLSMMAIGLFAVAGAVARRRKSTAAV